MKIINNALAGLLIDLFSKNRDVIIDYLEQAKYLKDSDLSNTEYKDALNELDNTYPTNSMSAYLQLRLVNFVNNQPIVALALGLAFIYNVVFYTVALLKKLL